MRGKVGKNIYPMRESPQSSKKSKRGVAWARKSYSESMEVITDKNRME